MKKSTKKMILWIALAALGAIVLWYLSHRRKQAQVAEAGKADETTRTLASAQEPPAPPAPPAPPLYVRDDVEALARVIASEAGARSSAAQTRIAWVARNRAAEQQTTIAALVCSPCGPLVGTRRPFSTNSPDTVRDREVAAYVLASPTREDPTRGATRLLDPRLIDQQFAAGNARHDARAIRRSWLQTQDYYGSGYGWDFFGPKNGPGALAVPEEWRLETTDGGAPAAVNMAEPVA